MKITIELTDAEIQGIKDYLREVGEVEKPTKADIQIFCSNELNACLQAPQCAVADYIAQYY